MTAILSLQVRSFTLLFFIQMFLHTTIRWIALTFGTYIHVPLRMDLNDPADVLYCFRIY